MHASTSSGLLVIRELLFFLCRVFPSELTVLFSLKPLDIEVMKRLGTRVNLIPVIAKADTLTQNDLQLFKQRVRHLACVH